MNFQVTLNRYIPPYEVNVLPQTIATVGDFMRVIGEIKCLVPEDNALNLGANVLLAIVEKKFPIDELFILGGLTFPAIKTTHYVEIPPNITLKGCSVQEGAIGFYKGELKRCGEKSKIMMIQETGYSYCDRPFKNSTTTYGKFTDDTRTPTTIQAACEVGREHAYSDSITWLGKTVLENQGSTDDFIKLKQVADISNASFFIGMVYWKGTVTEKNISEALSFLKKFTTNNANKCAFIVEYNEAIFTLDKIHALHPDTLAQSTKQVTNLPPTDLFILSDNHTVDQTYYETLKNRALEYEREGAYDQAIKIYFEIEDQFSNPSIKTFACFKIACLRLMARNTEYDSENTLIHFNRVQYCYEDTSNGVVRNDILLLWLKLAYAAKHKNNKEFKKAYDYYKQLIEKTDSPTEITAEAHYQIGLLYMEGLGVAPSLYTAMNHFSQAIASGHISASFSFQWASALLCEGLGKKDDASWIYQKLSVCTDPHMPLTLKTKAQERLSQHQINLSTLFGENDLAPIQISNNSSDVEAFFSNVIPPIANILYGNVSDETLKEDYFEIGMLYLKESSDTPKNEKLGITYLSLAYLYQSSQQATILKKLMPFACNFVHRNTIIRTNFDRHLEKDQIVQFIIHILYHSIQSTYTENIPPRLAAMAYTLAKFCVDMRIKKDKEVQWGDSGYERIENIIGNCLRIAKQGQYSPEDLHNVSLSLVKTIPYSYFEPIARNIYLEPHPLALYTFPEIFKLTCDHLDNDALLKEGCAYLNNTKEPRALIIAAHYFCMLANRQGLDQALITLDEHSTNGKAHYWLGLLYWNQGVFYVFDDTCDEAKHIQTIVKRALQCWEHARAKPNHNGEADYLISRILADEYPLYFPEGRHFSKRIYAQETLLCAFEENTITKLNLSHQERIIYFLTIAANQGHGKAAFSLAKNYEKDSEEWIFSAEEKITFMKRALHYYHIAHTAHYPNAETTLSNLAFHLGETYETNAKESTCSAEEKENRLQLAVHYYDIAHQAGFKGAALKAADLLATHSIKVGNVVFQTRDEITDTNKFTQAKIYYRAAARESSNSHTNSDKNSEPFLSGNERAISFLSQHDSAYFDDNKEEAQLFGNENDEALRRSSTSETKRPTVELYEEL